MISLFLTRNHRSTLCSQPENGPSDSLPPCSFWVLPVSGSSLPKSQEQKQGNGQQRGKKPEHSICLCGIVREAESVRRRWRVLKGE